MGLPDARHKRPDERVSGTESTAAGGQNLTVHARAGPGRTIAGAAHRPESA
jgi:hypothetical protein